MQSKKIWAITIILCVSLAGALGYWQYVYKPAQEPTGTGQEQPVTGIDTGRPVVDRTGRPPLREEIAGTLPLVEGHSASASNDGNAQMNKEAEPEPALIPEPPTVKENEIAESPAKDTTTVEQAENAVKEPVMSRAEPVDGSEGKVVGHAVTSPLLDRSARERFAGSSLVGKMFVDDLAGFLVSNYWPEGTHIRARGGSGYIGITPRMLNVRYGSQLTGFQLSGDNPPAARAKLLSYMFTPSMLKDLAATYSVRLLDTMQDRAGNLRRGHADRLLSGYEQAELFNQYADLCDSTGRVLAAYLSTPKIAALIKEFRMAELKAHQAGSKFFSARHEGADERSIQMLAGAYQDAIVQREFLRDSIISGIRRKGDTRNLDADDILFIVSWLDRRGEEGRDAVGALSDVLVNLARQLRERGASYM